MGGCGDVGGILSLWRARGPRCERPMHDLLRGACPKAKAKRGAPSVRRPDNARPKTADSRPAPRGNGSRFGAPFDRIGTGLGNDDRAPAESCQGGPGASEWNLRRPPGMQSP